MANTPIRSVKEIEAARAHAAVAMKNSRTQSGRLMALLVHDTLGWVLGEESELSTATPFIREGS